MSFTKNTSLVGIEAYELIHLIDCEQQIETRLCFAIQSPILQRSFIFVPSGI